MLHTVYKTTNNINGRYYIGVHSTDDLNDSYIGSGFLLKRAIVRYGRDNFQKQILRVCDTKQQAYDIERQLVQEALVRNDGSYNLAEGGSGHKGPNKASKQVVVYDNSLKRVSKFTTIVEAAKFLNVCATSVKQACDQSKIGKSSKVKEYYVSYKGFKPQKKNMEYLIERNKIEMPIHNIGRKKPEHGKLISQLNQQRPAAQEIFNFIHSSGIKFVGTRTQLREKFPSHNISRSELTALVHGRYKSHRGWSII